MNQQNTRRAKLTASILADRITRAQISGRELLAELLAEQERLIVLAARKPEAKQ